jgi:hypothetical protein
MKFIWIFLFITPNLIGCSPSTSKQFVELDSAEKLAFDLAQAQLDAYNARDIEAFMSVYSDSVKVYRFPDVLMMEGHDEMKARYASMFENTPDLHCLLVNRMVQGNTVIDQELVTRKKDEPKSQAIAIYKVALGKIQEVYFISN